jgi:hypothetical protein
VSRRTMPNRRVIQSRLMFTSGVWEGLQERANAKGTDLGLDPRAIPALRVAADNNVPALVELRCGRAGHLLASVHSTRHGPLLWTTHVRDKAPPAIRKEISGVLDKELPGWDGGLPGLKSITRTLGFREGLLHEDRAREMLAVFCRCGSNLLDFREMFDAAEVSLRERRTLQICAASTRS